MSDRIETQVLCEGYFDRAFWAGLLQHRLGWPDPSRSPGKSERETVRDLRGTPVRGRGQFGFYSPSGNFVRIVPCGGKDDVRKEARRVLQHRSTSGVARLVLIVDSDVSVGGAERETLSRESVLSLLTEHDPGLSVVGERFEIVAGAFAVRVVRWQADDADADGVPRLQTLERLVCAAICAAYPARGSCVQNWLDSRPEPPLPNVKEFAWSHMAGWYAGNNCEDFYSAVWRDPQVAAELESRLRATGAWNVVAELAA